jgi:hypothetical protein
MWAAAAMQPATEREPREDCPADNSSRAHTETAAHPLTSGTSGRQCRERWVIQPTPTCGACNQDRDATPIAAIVQNATLPSRDATPPRSAESRRSRGR